LTGRRGRGDVDDSNGGESLLAKVARALSVGDVAAGRRPGA
jgi:hypothetical protein